MSNPLNFESMMAQAAGAQLVKSMVQQQNAPQQQFQQQPTQFQQPWGPPPPAPMWNSQMPPPPIQPTQPAFGPPPQYMNWVSRSGKAATSDQCFTCACHKLDCRCGKYVNGQYAGRGKGNGPDPRLTQIEQRMAQLETGQQPPRQLPPQQLQAPAIPPTADAVVPPPPKPPTEAVPEWAKMLLAKQDSLTAAHEATGLRLVDIGTQVQQVQERQSEFESRLVRLESDLKKQGHAVEQCRVSKRGIKWGQAITDSRVDGVEKSFEELVDTLRKDKLIGPHKRLRKAVVELDDDEHERAIEDDDEAEPGAEGEAEGAADLLAQLATPATGPPAPSPAVAPEALPQRPAGQRRGQGRK